MTRKSVLYVLPLVALISACSLAPEYQKPDVAGSDRWRGQGEVINSADLDPLRSREWWNHFNSAEMTGYVVQAHSSNTDLDAAIQRVVQARANMRITGADRFPLMGASGNIGQNWDRALQSNTTSSDGWSGRASLSYEVDLFGRVANAVRSSELRAEASAHARDALSLVIESDVVTIYAQILAYNDRLKLTREQHEAAKEINRIVEIRFREGMVSGIELAQQRNELANFEATLANLEQSRRVAINQLAYLTGAAPQDFSEPTAALSSLAVPNLAALPPSELLVRRPDIRQSEALLKAANANIGIARAAFFPSISIGGDLSVMANPIGAAVNTAAGIAGSLSTPIFQGGRIAGGVQLSEAQRDEMIANYRGTILTAYREAEDALAALEGAETRLAAYEQAAEQSRTTYRLSKNRFDAGSIDFLTLLDAQRSLLSTESNLVQGRYDRVAAATQLFKAMGGGWTN